MFHFLLIDFEMPKDWSGYQLVENIRNYELQVGCPHHYIIGMDNDISEPKLIEAQTKGFDNVIEKPLNPGLMNKIIA